MSNNGRSIHPGDLAPFPKPDGAPAPPATKPATTPAPLAQATNPVDDFVHDLIPRLRDHKQNRLPYSWVWTLPVADGTPLEESQIQGVLQGLDGTRPLHASHLRYWFNEKLRYAIERFKRVREQVEREYREQRERAAARNAEIDKLQEDLETQRDEAARPAREELERRERALEEAQQAAGSRCAVVGGSYDPENPHTDAALVPPLEDRKKILADEQLPDPSDDGKPFLPAWAENVATALIGAILGISLGLIGGFLVPATLGRNLEVLLGCVVLGQPPAYFMRKALVALFKFASEVAYLGRPWWAKLAAFGLACTVLATLSAVDIFVEYNGFLKLAQVDAALDSLSGPTQTGDHSGASLAALGMFLAAAIITLGYLLYSACQGWVYGRSLVIENRVEQVRLARRNRHDESRREIPEVQQALNAVHDVLECRRRRDLQAGRLAEVIQPYDQEIEALESSRPLAPDQLSQEQKHRLQDEFDNLQGAQLEFDRLLEGELQLAEGNWWERLVGQSKDRRRLRAG